MNPPRLAEWVLARLLPPDLGDAVLGDLAEIFADEAARAPFGARLRYWCRAAGAVRHLVVARRPGQRRHSGDRLMTTMLRDFTRGLRLFVTQPGYAWAAVVTLALAIGANTLIFSIANVLVIKPLPFREPGTLGWILATAPGSPPDRAGVSLPEYATFRDEVTLLSDLAAWRRHSVALRHGERSDSVIAHTIVGGLQTLWGLEAERGRTLTRIDERPGSERTVVLSHNFWNTRFGRDEGIVGRPVLIDGQPYLVVGVLAPDIELGNLAEIAVWLPHSADPRFGPRGERGWRAVGRLAGGATLQDLQSQLVTVASRITQDFPELTQAWTVRAGSTREAMGGTNTWLVLSLLSVVVGLLLLLACANIMNLLIARLVGRRQELAVRTALGATRAQVVRQIVSESLLLGTAGGALGLIVAWAGLRAMHAVATEPFFKQIDFDFRVLLFAVALSFVAPLAFSILPTVRMLREDVRASLNEGSQRSLGSVAAARGRSALVILQVSLAVTLLVVSALVVQSMQAVTTAEPGYDQSRLLMAEIDVAAWHMPDDAAALRLRQQLIEAVRAMPGVEDATLSTVVPALQFAPEVALAIIGRPAPDIRDRPRARVSVVSASFFDTVGIPLLAGRGFVPADASSPQPVAVITAEAARRFWGDAQSAIGARIEVDHPAGPATSATVIGVSRNTIDPDLAQVSTPGVFMLDDHRLVRRTHVLVRAAAPDTLASTLRQTLAGVDADLPVAQLRTVAAAMRDENSSNRLLSGMFAAFATVAILLAMAGLYGVMSYAVSQRAPEIAVRVALGASAASIAGQVVGHSVRLAAIGTAIGIVSAFALAQAVKSVLYGVTASDPVTYVGAAVLTMMAALAASWLPTRRALSVDPLVALRQT